MRFQAQHGGPDHLVTASQDNLRILSASNGRLLHHFDAGWDHLVAINLTHENQLLAGEFQSNFASSWAAELMDVLGDAGGVPQGDPAEAKSTVVRPVTNG